MLQPHDHGPVTRLTLARTAFGRPLVTVEIYLVDGWLVDSGPPATGAELVRFAIDQLEQRERKPLRGVVNTHQHEDHAGGDAALLQGLGLVPRAPELTIPILASPPRLEPYRWFIWGQPRPVHAEPLGEWLQTDHHRFRVIPTPGHCHDHVCLLDASEGWLFSGDLFIAERVKYLRADEDACTTLDSLRHALTLDFDTLYCSHAGIIPNGQAALRRKLDYWENLQGRARELRRSGVSPSSIRDQLLGPEGRMAPITLGHFSKLNLIKALLGDQVNRL